MSIYSGLSTAGSPQILKTHRNGKPQKGRRRQLICNNREKKNIYQYQSPPFFWKGHAMGKKVAGTNEFAFFRCRSMCTKGGPESGRKNFKTCLLAGTGTKIYFSSINTNAILKMSCAIGNYPTTSTYGHPPGPCVCVCVCGTQLLRKAPPSSKLQREKPLRHSGKRPIKLSPLRRGNGPLR